ncbi:MAG: carbon-nitrogen hydrolase family protein [Pseudomonadota bacterium]
MLRIALASPPIAGSIAGSLVWVEQLLFEAASQNADIVCFPETYIPGLRGLDFPVDQVDPEGLHKARDRVCQWAAQASVCVILPMEWPGPNGLLNVAFVISDQGAVVGCQTKNQLAPEEDAFYVPGTSRDMFEVKGVPFGIAICHEGWRYPETVRWAARRGARIVFHPSLTGSDRQGAEILSWAAAHSPYYEKAMICRSLENAIYFASVNYGMRYQDAATAIVSPEGACVAQLPYGEAGTLVTAIDPEAADRLYATRLQPEAYS